MSYCRFSDGDVYAYACDGGVQFWVAGDADKALDRLCNTYNEAYQYAKALRDGHGLDVPSYAIEALREDAADEAERYFGPNGVVAELRAENAKLRERVDTLEWLLKLTLKYAEEGELDRYELCDLCNRLGACENHPATSCTRTFDTSLDFIRERMRELGVEEGE